VTIGALDGDISGRFYDALMSAIGAERKFSEGGWIGYGRKGEESHSVYICPPFDGKLASAGNGTMISFLAPSKEAVNKAYEAALAAGGTDEGAPGPRPADSATLHGCYLRDPTGNKICVYAKGPFV